jgi:hypothetical protein
MKKHSWQLILKTTMRVVLNVKELLLITNQIIISNRVSRGTHRSEVGSRNEVVSSTS